MKKILGIIFALVLVVLLASCDEGHTHTFNESWNSDATHHWHGATCEHTDEVCDKTEHSWDAGTITLVPTEETEGKKTFTCTVCQYKKEEKVEKLDHTHNWVDATCTSPKTCSKCNETEGEALEHTPATAVEENRVEASCKAAGSYDLVVYCTACETEISREAKTIAQLEHTPAAAVEENIVNASCEAAGSYDLVVYCSVCETEISREAKTIAQLEHTPVVDEKVEPTCTETGLTAGSHCSVCNAVIVAQEEVEATGHDYSTTWSKDETNHWHECHCGDKKDLASHDGGNATETQKAICSACETEYGSLLPTYLGTMADIKAYGIISGNTLTFSYTTENTSDFQISQFITFGDGVVYEVRFKEGWVGVYNWNASAWVEWNGKVENPIYNNVENGRLISQTTDLTFFADLGVDISNPTILLAKEMSEAYLIYNDTKYLSFDDKSGWLALDGEEHTFTYTKKELVSELISLGTFGASNVSAYAKIEGTKLTMRYEVAEGTVPGEINQFFIFNTDVVYEVRFNQAGWTGIWNWTKVDWELWNAKVTIPTYETVDGKYVMTQVIELTYFSDLGLDINSIKYDATENLSGETHLVFNYSNVDFNNHSTWVNLIDLFEGNVCIHTLSEAVEENRVAATCEAAGSYDLVVYCSSCHTEISRETKTITQLDHTAAEAVEENRVAATCTKAGSYELVVYCTVCETELSREAKTIAQLEHTPAEAVEENRVAATCTTKGSYDLVVYCGVCNTELSRTNNELNLLDHAFDENAWDYKDQNGHAHCCVNCDAHSEVVAHVSSGAATETEAEVCTECGYIIAEATGHIIHTPKDGWKYDATHHWHECVGCSTEKINYEEHTPAEAVEENKVAATCKTAGSYDLVVYCSVCGTEITREAKTIAQLEHTPVVDEKVEPTCTETGLTAGSHCLVCNTVIEEQTIIEATGHTYDAEVWKNDENSHWNECHCGEKLNIENHKGGQATGIEKAICSVCETTYGNLLPTFIGVFGASNINAYATLEGNILTMSYEVANGTVPGEINQFFIFDTDVVYEVRFNQAGWTAVWNWTKVDWEAYNAKLGIPTYTTVDGKYVMTQVIDLTYFSDLGLDITLIKFNAGENLQGETHLMHNGNRVDFNNHSTWVDLKAVLSGEETNEPEVNDGFLGTFGASNVSAYATLEGNILTMRYEVAEGTVPGQINQFFIFNTDVVYEVRFDQAGWTGVWNWTKVDWEAYTGKLGIPTYTTVDGKYVMTQVIDLTYFSDLGLDISSIKFDAAENLETHLIHDGSQVDFNNHSTWVVLK